MNSTIECLEKSMVKLTIELDEKQFEEGLKFAYNKNKNSIVIPGFRKGKVPRSLIEKTYGTSIFYEDAANYLLKDSYDEAIKEHNLDTVSRPEIDIVQIEKGKPFIFTATIAVKPEVKLGEYKGLEVEKQSFEVTDEEILKEIDKIREQNSRLISIDDRSVQEDDQVIIDFEGFVNGEPFEGGKADDYSLVIGSHSFIDTFEEQLIGKNINDEVEVNVTFPEQYQKEELQGAPAMFKVTIKEIKVKELPELDDEFVKDVSEFDTLDEYKTDIKEKLKKQKENTSKQEKQNEVLKKAIENAELEVPQPMIELQAEQMVNDFEQRIKYQGMTLEQYLGYLGQNIDTFQKQFKPEAEKNIKSRLILEAIVKAESIEVSEEDINNEIEKMATMYKMEADKFKQAISDHEKEHMKEDISVQKALDFITDLAVEV